MNVACTIYCFVSSFYVLNLLTFCFLIGQNKKAMEQCVVIRNVSLITESNERLHALCSKGVYQCLSGELTKISLKCIGL